VDVHEGVWQHGCHLCVCFVRTVISHRFHGNKDCEQFLQAEPQQHIARTDVLPRQHALWQDSRPGMSVCYFAGYFLTPFFVFNRDLILTWGYNDT